MRARLAFAFVAALAALPALAQQDRTQTLADIRQQLAVLNVELQGLRTELNTTGAPNVAVGGSTVLDRVNAIEQELQRLTQATERMEFRIESVSRDGAARIEDLRFQLCELTDECDLMALPDPGPLGETGAGGTESPASEGILSTAPTTTGPQLAVSERAEFDAAKAAFDSGDTAAAAEAFGRFVTAYPTGPLTGEAQFLRGQALAAENRHAEAARAYLESFSGTPEGPYAARALVGLGTALGALGQRDEACLTLSEVAVRFPDSPAVAQANAALSGLGCS